MDGMIILKCVPKTQDLGKNLIITPLVGYSEHVIIEAPGFV